MNNELDLVLDLVVAMSAALVGGWITVRLGLSAIAGYVLAGIVISPFTPGFVGDVDRLRALADIGVILIMFGIGVQFSLRDLTSVGLPVSAAVVAQIAIVMLATFAAGAAIDWSRNEALFAGAAVASASSMVLAKLLGDRGETGSAHGGLALAFSIVQDVILVAIVAVLLALAEEGDVGSAVLIASLKGLAFIAAVLIIGMRLIPWILERVADIGSRELFILAIAALALGTAYASETVGLSIALGAFLAGIIVSESDLSHRVLGELLPARDVFAVLFFVSVGMLIDPDVVVEEPVTFVTLIVLIIVVKGVAAGASLRAAGQQPVTAVMAGGLLAQSGEFSFVFVGLGVDSGAVTDDVFSLIVAATAVSIVLAPGVSAAAARIARRGDAEPDLSPLQGDAPQRSRLGRHAVICGYGEVGQIVASALRSRFEIVVVDQDPRAVRGIAGDDLRVVIGDASSPAIIEQMRLEECRVLVIAIGDPFATRLLVERARAAQPDIDIIARAVSAEEASKLQSSGAEFAIEANRELALEMVRHSLHRFGIDQRQALAIVQRMRAG
jgi:CPA2 family monovalent cation:H+ antiporter-2